MKTGLWMMVVALAAGCSGDNPDYPPTDLDSAFTECNEAADCVVVELGCCDECNGGFAVSVNTASVDQVREDFSQTCAGNTACTEIGCNSWEVTCDEGTCGAQRESF